jgi:hypothetical protein
LSAGTQQQFSDYIVYVDESGDHGLESIDTNYPIFVLVFCIFRKQDYIDKVIPQLMQLKMQLWGHTEVVLHEHDIRKPQKDGPFAILFDKDIRQNFVVSLNNLMSSVPFTLIASVIDKNRLKQQYTIPTNPYEISLSFGLERVFRYLNDPSQAQKRTSVIVEKRGKKEDDELELVFRRICDGVNYFNKPMPFNMVMVDKRSNSSGLQIADLTARPIGIKTLRPTQPNRAYDIIKTKFRMDKNGRIDGWGLKLFP